MQRSRPLLPLFLALVIFLGLSVCPPFCRASLLRLAADAGFATADTQQKSSPDQLIKTLSSDDPVVRGESLRALEALPAGQVVPKIIDALQTADEELASRLVKVLVEHPAPGEVGPLIALAQKYNGLGSEVFAVLGPEGTHGLMAAAIKNCHSTVGDKSFPIWAGQTASLGGAQARTILRQEALAENPCIRQAALWGLAAQRADEPLSAEEMRDTAKIIVGRLADKNQDVVDTAKSLVTPDPERGRYNNDPMEEFVVQALLDFFHAQTTNPLRAKSLSILALYGDSSVQEMMNNLATDPDPEIKRIASSYSPPQYESDRAEHTESPPSGITSPEIAAQIDRLRKSQNPVDRVAAAKQMAKSNDVVYTAPLIELLKDPIHPCSRGCRRRARHP